MGADVGVHDKNVAVRGLVLDRDSSGNKMALYQISNGTWGAALAETSATINDSTYYNLRVSVRQGKVEAYFDNQSSVTLAYDSTTEILAGRCGLFSDRTQVRFKNFKANRLTARDPLTLRTDGSSYTEVSNGELLVQGTGATDRGGEAAIEGFSDDYYVVQVDATNLIPFPALVTDERSRP